MPNLPTSPTPIPLFREPVMSHCRPPTEDVSWDNFNTYVAQANYMILPVPGTGFCFFNAIELCLMLKYEFSITVEQIKMMTLAYIRANRDRLAQFHGGPLLAETLQFFKDGLFVGRKANVVDVILSITPLALKINLYIYQKGPDGNVQVLKVMNEANNMDVHLKFTHDNLHSNGNHYEALVPSVNHEDPEPEEEAVEDIHVGTETKEVLVPVQTEVVDLTGEDDDASIFKEPDIPMKRTEVCMGPSAKYWMQEEDIRGYKFPLHLFAGVKPEVIDYLPGDINGKHIYKIRCSAKEWHVAASDQRYFKMNTSRRAGLVGIRKVGECSGSLFCPNADCHFQGTSGNVNETFFQNLDSSKSCFTCGVFAASTACGARKMTEYDFNSQILTVWHVGNHTCKPKLDRKKHIDKIRKAIMKNKSLGPVEVKMLEVGDATDKGDIEEGRRRARELNWKRMRQVKGGLSRETNPNNQCLEAVAVYKATVDEDDEFLIAKIQDHRYQGSCDFVAKSSQEMVELMSLMDQTLEKNPLQNIEVYFDGAHSRVSGYVSLGLWCVHPAMRKLLRLMTMEVKSENTEAVKEFFSVLNEMLSKKARKKVWFNPKCIMVDEAAANYRGIEEAFNLEYRMEKVISCQKHYQANVVLKSKTIPHAYREEFKKTCFQLCSCTTVAKYDELMAVLEKYISLYPQIESFVRWWDARKYHVFTPFRRYGHVASTLAEPGNAMCKRRNQLYLLEAAKDDVRTMTIQVEDYKAFLRQECESSGTAPNQVAKAADDRRIQMKMAQAFAQEHRDERARARDREEAASTTAFRPSATGKHRPTQRKGIQGTVINAQTGRKAPASRSKQPAAPTGVLERSMDMARAVMEEENEDQEEEPKEEERPCIEIYMGRNIKRCQGCPDEILKAEMKPPKDFVISTVGVRSWLDERSHQRRFKRGKLYFHLNMECLQGKYGNKFKKEHLKMDVDTRNILTREHLRYLKSKGFLEVVMSDRT